MTSTSGDVDASSPGTKKSWSGPLKTSGAVLAFLVAVVSLWQIEVVRSTVCKGWLGGPNVSLCDQEYWRVEGEQAREVIETFVSRASGPGDDRAWLLLTSSLQDSRYGDLQTFTKEWDEDWWAEAVGRPNRTGGNTFVVTIRHYEREGQVTERASTLRFTSTDDGARIAHYEPGERARAYPQAFPTVTTDHAEATWVLPRSSSPQALVRGTFMETGGSLTALCELEIDGSGHPDVEPADIGWWTRTQHGWIPNSALLEGHAGRIGELTDCDPRAAER